MRKHLLAVVLLGLGAACGCGRQDVDRLARVGRAVGVKFQGMTAVAQQRLPPGLRDMHLGADTLEGRVLTRLHWDKALHDAVIEVRAAGNAVTLRGSVADVAQRQLAVRLAQSTVGVEQVADNLTVSSP